MLLRVFFGGWSFIIDKIINIVYNQQPFSASFVSHNGIPQSCHPNIFILFEAVLGLFISVNPSRYEICKSGLPLFSPSNYY